MAITKWKKNRFHERDAANLSDEEYEEVKRVISIYQDILNIFNKMPQNLKDGELVNEVHERALENILGFGLYGLVKKTEDGHLIRRTEYSEKNLRGWGFANDIGEDPPDCVISEPLEPHLPNLYEFSRIILALTFDAGPPQNRTARNYVFYFFKGLPDLNRHPDDILVFKVKVDNPSEVHLVSKYLGGNAWFAENAPPLSQRQSWQPGWMSPHGRIKSEKFVKDMYRKKGIPEDLIDQVWKETEGIKTEEITKQESSPTKEQKTGCFIATAALGTPLAEEVLILSKFRDEYLSKITWGRRFISFYNRVSPFLACFIAGKKGLRWIVRSTIIYPIIKLLTKITSVNNNIEK